MNQTWIQNCHTSSLYEKGVPNSECHCLTHLEDDLGLLPGRQLEHVALRLGVLAVEDVDQTDQVLLLQPVLLLEVIMRLYYEVILLL